MRFSSKTFSLDSNDSYRMPAEWEKHKATWLTWPHDEAHWPGKFEKVAPIWARMVKELETGEEIHINIHDEQTETAAKKAMEQAHVIGKNVHLHRIPNNYSWARDHGPIFIRDSKNQLLISHWQYNAWGNKWKHEQDDLVPTKISTLIDVPELTIPMVLEGGSIDVNGAGLLLTTTSCLLNQNRNPSLTKEQIEKYLSAVLGAEKVLWLGDGIAGDDTDGHIDDFARFVNENTVLTMVEKDKNDLNYKALKMNLNMLRTMTNQDEKPLEIIEVQMPDPIIHECHRLPASYANFYIGNEVILLPVFEMKSDQAAVDTLSRLFPDRRVAAIPSRDLVWGLGAFHCITQQQPL